VRRFWIASPARAGIGKSMGSMCLRQCVALRSDLFPPVVFLLRDHARSGKMGRPRRITASPSDDRTGRTIQQVGPSEHKLAQIVRFVPSVCAPLRSQRLTQPNIRGSCGQSILPGCRVRATQVVGSVSLGRDYGVLSRWSGRVKTYAEQTRVGPVLPAFICR
jgi:hypothetical protein